MDNTTAKPPIHLWIVGGLATLWNGFGCFDYLMTRTRGTAYIESMMHTDDGEAIMAYINGFPIWAAAGWGLGVWGGLAGAILLLMRHRWAVRCCSPPWSARSSASATSSPIRLASSNSRWG